jgi:antitoxin (DNA-binding transcriptional repressor) of toxin-antitoxin stability system
VVTTAATLTQHGITLPTVRIGEFYDAAMFSKARSRSMSQTITIDEAQANLKELIHRLAPGEEVVITENLQAVARLVSEPSRPKQSTGLRLPPGLGKGYITVIADDDEHLKDFGEYMP